MDKKPKTAEKIIPDNDNSVPRLSPTPVKLPKKKHSNEPSVYEKSGKTGG